jgi:hypothetical protein
MSPYVSHIYFITICLRNTSGLYMNIHIWVIMALLRIALLSCLFRPSRMSLHQGKLNRSCLDRNLTAASSQIYTQQRFWI